MATVNIDEAKTRLSQLVDQAASGEDVVLCRNGKPLVRITQLSVPKRRIKFGVLKGKVRIAADFDAPLPRGRAARIRGALMRLLLDTHVFLWAVAGSPLLKPATPSQAIAEPLRLMTADATLAQYSDLVMLI